MVVLLLGLALVTQAQQKSERAPRIGVLTFTRLTAGFQEPFRQGLREHGYVEGQNLLIEWRAAEGRPERATALATELVHLKVDVIVANLTPAVQAAKNATSTIPIVMASAGDPVGTGFVAKPGPARRQHHGHDGHLSRVVGEASGPTSRTRPEAHSGRLVGECLESIRQVAG